jgi:hypothetical protein
VQNFIVILRLSHRQAVTSNLVPVPLKSLHSKTKQDYGVT